MPSGPPTLPIQNRSNVPVLSPKSGKRDASPTPAKVRTTSQPSKRNQAAQKVRAWADYTPTPFLDYTPTPWASRDALAPFGMGAFGPHIPGPFMTGPGGLHNGEGLDHLSEPSKVWPATPTPSAGASTSYNFGLGGDRPDLMPHLAGLGLPLQAPPRVAAMAAAAAAAAAGAAAAAAAAAGVDGGMELDGDLSSAGRQLLLEAYAPTTASPPRRQQAAPGPIGYPGTRPAADGSGFAQVKNTFIHVEEDEEADDDNFMVVKSVTMPNMFSRDLSSPIRNKGTPQMVNLAGSPHQGLPSRGSNMHGTGKCRPCAWFWKPQKCQNLDECGYCHLCPEGELKSRKKSKVTAMRMGALAPAKAGANSGTARVLKLSPLL